MGATERLATAVVETSWEDLPQDVVQAAKVMVLDGVGNMIASSSSAAGEILIPYFREFGGCEQSSVIGAGLKTDMLSAAFANGTFGHYLDYEMIGKPLHHPTSPVLPAVLALAEDRHMSGREVILALVLGVETAGRLLLDVEPDAIMASLHPVGAIGSVSAAVACAKLLNLDVWHTRMAVALGGSRACGVMANTGTLTKSTHCGNGARLGLEAALLAERGWQADENALEGFQGYYETFYDGRVDREKIFQGFGDPYRLVDPGVWFKLYPSQGPTHWPLQAALNIKRKYDVQADNIKSIEIEVGEGCESAIRPTSPKPKDGLDGKYSVHYTVSAALIDGQVVIDTFSDKRRFSPDIDAMLDRVTVKINPDVYAMNFEEAWARVSVTLNDGTVLDERVDAPDGFWGKPPTREQVLAKFDDCAVRTLSKDRIPQVISAIEELDAAPDVTPLMQLIG